ncbi:MAG: hypothetical protein E7346_06405 [Clostridiales bacterium]|nr:hypothetical protein [Clostridiales bacterium]
MQEYYKILGIDQTASDEDVEKAYATLRKKYQEERFLEGEKGNEAAKNLTKLETAYYEIKESRKTVKKNDDQTTYDFSEIERLIKNGNISAAQSALDDCNDRNAEWHYLQSVVFYKKNWMSESKKQLEIALNMDPYNNKYSDSYTKLKQKMEFNDRQFHSGNAGYSAGPNGQYQQQNNYNQQMGGSDSNGCLSFCTTWCCMNLLCNMCCGQ